MQKLISGIQQIGIGVPDVHKAWTWYRKAFGIDVRMFEEAAEAARKTAEEALANQSSELDYSLASAQLAEASARLATLRKLKNRAGR